MKKREKELEDFLFNQLERLDDQKLKGDELKQEINRSDAIGRAAGRIINNRKLILDAVRVSESSGLLLPEFLDTEAIPQKQKQLALPDDSRGRRPLLRARRNNEE